MQVFDNSTVLTRLNNPPRVITRIRQRRVHGFTELHWHCIRLFLFASSLPRWLTRQRKTCCVSVTLQNQHAYDFNPNCLPGWVSSANGNCMYRISADEEVLPFADAETCKIPKYPTPSYFLSINFAAYALPRETSRQNLTRRALTTYSCLRCMFRCLQSVGVNIHWLILRY